MKVWQPDEGEINQTKSWGTWSKEASEFPWSYSDRETYKMAKLSLDAGYKDVTVYNSFVEEWSGDPDQPLDFLKNYQSLAYPRWMMEFLNGSRPHTYLNNRYVICHSQYGNRDDY